MKARSSKVKGQSLAKILLLPTAFCVLLTAFCILPPVISGSEKWPGVDESVVEKIAKEHGRKAKEPFFKNDQGDLLLFAFLLAGAVGGFIGGYYWRGLMEKRVNRAQILKKDV